MIARISYRADRLAVSLVSGILLLLHDFDPECVSAFFRLIFSLFFPSIASLLRCRRAWLLDLLFWSPPTYLSLFSLVATPVLTASRVSSFAPPLSVSLYLCLSLCLSLPSLPLSPTHTLSLSLTRSLTHSLPLSTNLYNCSYIYHHLHSHFRRAYTAIIYRAGGVLQSRARAPNMGEAVM